MENSNKKVNTVFTLRIDTQIFEQVRENAKQNRRSIAKEIEYVLYKHLNK